MLEFNIYIAILVWIIPLSLLVGIGFYFEEKDFTAYIKKKGLQKQAAEYDRLRDEEWRELGWTEKY